VRPTQSFTVASVFSYFLCYVLKTQQLVRATIIGRYSTRWSLFYCHLIASIKYEEIRQLNRKQVCEPLVQNQSYIQHAYVRHDGVSSLHNGELRAGSFRNRRV